MSSRTMDRPWCFGKNTKIITGGFEANGALDPVVVWGEGVSSVEYISTGWYKITLDDAYQKMSGMGHSFIAEDLFSAHFTCSIPSGASGKTEINVVTYKLQGGGTMASDDLVGFFTFNIAFDDSGAFTNHGNTVEV